jgi:hypothetical protein
LAPLNPTIALVHAAGCSVPERCPDPARSRHVENVIDELDGCRLYPDKLVAKTVLDAFAKIEDTDQVLRLQADVTRDS